MLFPAMTPPEIKDTINNYSNVLKVKSQMSEMEKSISQSEEKIKIKLPEVEKVQKQLDDMLPYFELGEVNRKDIENLKKNLQKEEAVLAELQVELNARMKAMLILKSRGEEETKKAQEAESQRVQQNIDELLKTFSVADSIKNFRLLFELKLKKIQTNFERENSLQEDILKNYSNNVLGLVEIISLKWDGTEFRTIVGRLSKRT